jgi:hypothetical protein
MTARQLPDLWNSCYEGEHRKLSPAEFREEWCGKCLNTGCRNSRGTELKWLQRMLTQEDILLDNPRFADPQDPKFQRIREQDFQDMVRHALTIEVSTRKGDWSIPTEAEIGRAAAEMVGLVAPSGFQKAPEPEPEIASEDDPKPPERLVDEVHESDLPEPVLTISPEGDYAHLGTSRVIVSPLQSERGFTGGPADHLLPPDIIPEIEVEVATTPSDARSLEGTWKAEIDEDIQVDLISDPPQLKGQWKVRGDSGAIYEVKLKLDGSGQESWECSCPSRENPCKHARSIETRLSRAAPEPESSDGPQQPTRPPPGPTFSPPRMNTQLPSGGQMIGGAPPPKPESPADPWAAPPPKPTERVIPVGGRVRFGGGKKG